MEKQSYKLRDVLSVSSVIFAMLTFVCMTYTFLGFLFFAAAAVIMSPVISQRIAEKMNREKFGRGARFGFSLLLFIVGSCVANAGGKSPYQNTAPIQEVQKPAVKKELPKPTPVKAKAKPTPKPKPKAVDPTVAIAGEKPENSAWDGSVRSVKKYLEANAPYSKDIEYEGWYPVVATKAKDGKPCWGVRVVFRMENQFGAKEKLNGYFHIRNNEVIEVAEMTN